MRQKRNLASDPGETRTHLDETTVWGFALLTLALLVVGIYFNLQTLAHDREHVPEPPRLESNETPRSITV